MTSSSSPSTVPVPLTVLLPSSSSSSCSSSSSSCSSSLLLLLPGLDSPALLSPEELEVASLVFARARFLGDGGGGGGLLSCLPPTLGRLRAWYPRLR